MLLARIKIVAMKVIKTNISDVVILEPRVFGDERGYFFESFSQREFNEQVAEVTFVQDNESKSSYGVVRGLHYQLPPYTQAKLVRVVEGEVLDVVVDLRKNSATFGKHVAVVLSGENKRQFFIPKGFAHGFAVLSPQAVFQYKCDNYYAPQYESGIQFDDPALGIDWKIPEAEMILSAKDRMHKRLEEAFVFEGSVARSPINDPLCVPVHANGFRSVPPRYSHPADRKDIPSALSPSATTQHQTKR